jgi:uncharacterized membrane protein
MRLTYNRFSGQNLERLAALSDGIFAVAMTLLVLDLRVPVIQNIQGEQALWQVFVSLLPRLLTYFMSFLSLGIFWIAQQTQLNHYARSDRNFTWIHLAFLFAVTLMPFTTGFLSEYIQFRLPLILYWLNLLLLGVMLYASVRYAWQNGLVREGTDPDIRAAQVRRVLFYQALYAVGALLSVFNTYVSIGFIILVEMTSVIAPRIPPFDRF